MNLPNKPKVLAATYNPVSNTKMISFLVDFPTVLLAQVSQHRVIAQLQSAESEIDYAYYAQDVVNENKSANSARAIPVNKYLEKVSNNPFVPIWTKQQKGMSGDIVNLETAEKADEIWLSHLKGSEYSFDNSVEHCSEQFKEINIHKQNANRLLAPFAYTTCILTGTEWDNFFKLRCPKYTSENIVANSQKEYSKIAVKLGKIYPSDSEDWQSINQSSAQPEFQIIAEMLYDLYQEAAWKESKYHIPFEEEIDEKYNTDVFKLIFSKSGSNATIESRDMYYELLMKISASMCAKLSYNTQDNEDTLEKHLERADMLIEHKHQEPFSHQAIAMNDDEYEMFTVTKLVNYKYVNANINHINSLGSLQQIAEKGKCYNLTGFISQRYILENY